MVSSLVTNRLLARCHNIQAGQSRENAPERFGGGCGITEGLEAGVPDLVKAKNCSYLLHEIFQRASVVQPLQFSG